MSEPLRVVLDTTITVSALLLSRGPAAPLRPRWRKRQFVPLLSAGTIGRIELVLQYPEFRLSAEQRKELLSDYVPFCDVVPDAAGGSLLEVARKGHATWIITDEKPALASKRLPCTPVPLGAFVVLLGVPLFESLEV